MMPAELEREAWTENIDHRVVKRLWRLFADSPLDSAEERARVAIWAMRIIAEHPSELVRDQYTEDVAARVRISVDLLRRSTKAFEG
jgi:hypothetical protein